MQTNYLGNPRYNPYHNMHLSAQCVFEVAPHFFGVSNTLNPIGIMFLLTDLICLIMFQLLYTFC